MTRIRMSLCLACWRLACVLWLTKPLRKVLKRLGYWAYFGCLASLSHQQLVELHAAALKLKAGIRQ